MTVEIRFVNKTETLAANHGIQESKIIVITCLKGDYVSLCFVWTLTKIEIITHQKLKIGIRSVHKNY